MAQGLRLQQDAPVLFSDFETKVLPVVNEAFGSAYTAHLLNRMEGGIYFSLRNGKQCTTDGFQVRFDFANFGTWFGIDPLLPHYEEPGPLIPWNHKGDWVHTLGYKTDQKGWTKVERDTLQIALVKVLQWRPLSSPGYKKTKPYYIEPADYNYIDQIPEKYRPYWNRRFSKSHFRQMYVKQPRELQYPTCYDERESARIKDASKRKATEYWEHDEEGNAKRIK